MVRWAPGSLPLERRLQTAAILFGLIVLPGVVALIAAMIFYPPWVNWYSREIFAAYCAWQIIFDRKTARRGGRAFSFVRNFPVWRYVASYFPAELHVTRKFESGKPRIFCLHPHGIISIATICNLIFGVNSPNELLGIDYRIVTVSFNFLLPFWRDIIMGLGFIVADRESIRYMLKHKESVMIVIGGAQETLHANPGTVELVLKKRIGFVRLALQYGAELVPVFHFGENELYTQFQHPILRKLQDLATRILGFTIPAVRGRGIFQYDFGILPRRVPLHTVVGEPIEIPHLPNPTEQEIQHHHDRYIAALEKLYNDNKDAYCKPTDFYGNPLPPAPLKIVA